MLTLQIQSGHLSALSNSQRAGMRVRMLKKAWHPVLHKPLEVDQLMHCFAAGSA